MELRGERKKLIRKTSIFIFLFLSTSIFLTSSITAKTTCLDEFWCPWSGKADLYDSQKLEKIKGNPMPKENKGISTSIARRFLGLGSSPPRCASKCGKCIPCKPVHVPVPPGTPVTAEYYPEAWRCKCGNRLYMP